MPRALVAQIDLEAVGEEGEEVDSNTHSVVGFADCRSNAPSRAIRRSFRCLRRSIVDARLRRPRQCFQASRWSRALHASRTIANRVRSRCADRLDERKPQLILQHNPDHPQRRSPQRVGVFAAGRLLVDRPEADQRIELVGERDGDRDRRGRDAVVRALRLVVFLDRVGDARLFALRRRVIAAHQALQLGKLADHFGDEIGLGELRRALGEARVGADDRRQFSRQRGDALDALALRAELLVEDDVQRLQLLQPLVERLFRLVGIVVQRREVGAPEVARVGQPRPHDAPVARRDRRPAVAGDEVGDEDELVGEARLALPSASWPGLTRPSTSFACPPAPPGWPGQARP